jgi:pSer/pThr/pTyr-binding forkhead associated (FHA) protein
MGPGFSTTGANGHPPIDGMVSFLTACGAAGPLTLEVEGPEGLGIGQIVVSRPFALLGRDDRADVLLDHDLVSRRHTFLQVIDGRVFFIDLESREKTLLDGMPAESGWLLPGRTLGVGPFRIRLAATSDEAASAGAEQGLGPIPAPHATPPPPNPLLARSTESTELPRVVLEFESRSAGHSVWRMSQVMAVLGRSPRCKVRLYDAKVSKLHCVLLRTASGLWVVDLLGRDGITVNGQPVRYALLGEGDVLGVSKVLMRPTFGDRSSHMDAMPWGGGISIGASSPSLPVLPVSRTWGVPASVPNNAAVPADANGFPTSAAGTPPAYPAVNPSEPALAMLLNHFGQMFGQMQQQQNDQFQQSMLMMMQMFGNMHREQMGILREELDRLRELSAEVQSIKSQMAYPPQFRPAAPSLGGVGAGGMLPPNWPSQGFTPPTRPMAPSAPTPPPRPSAAGPGPSTAATPPDRGTGPTPPPAAAPKPQAPPDGANLDPKVHDWLTERLAAVQQEQQTRWQRVLGMIGKKS